MPIDRVGTVTIFVADQDRALAFYTDVLGMELRTDAPLYPGAQARWIAVAPPGAETEIILYLVDEEWAHYRGVVGKSQALTLHVPDVAEAYEKLRARGVTFVDAPQEQEWGTFATIEDSEGNRLLLTEPADDTPITVAELLRRIERSRQALEQTVAPLSEAQLTARGPSGWAVKDHLAHLATWELGIVELLHSRPRFEAMGVGEAVLNGKSEDEINDLIFRRRANRTAADVLAYFADVHERMLEVLRAMDDEDLMRPYASFLPEGATGSNLPVIGWIVGNTYAHYDEHRRYVEALVDSLDRDRGAAGGRAHPDAVEPIRRTLQVPLPVERAFELFALGLVSWWPREYTWAGDLLDEIGIEPRAGGHCFERGPHGFVCDWGRVLVWVPPHELTFSWQISPARVPEPNPARASEVELRFEPAGEGQARVRFEHRAFERHGTGAAEYRAAMDAPGGWDYILDRYVAAASEGCDPPPLRV